MQYNTFLLWLLCILEEWGHGSYEQKVSMDEISYRKPSLALGKICIKLLSKDLLATRTAKTSCIAQIY